MKVIGREKVYERIVHDLMINKITADTNKNNSENTKKEWNIINVLPSVKLNERQSKYLSNELYKIFRKYCTA